MGGAFVLYNYLYYMSDEDNNLLERLSDIEERIDQLERAAESTGGILKQLVEQLLEIRRPLSQSPPIPIDNF